MIREAIEKLVSGHSLMQEEAAAVMEEIMTGQATQAQIGSFLTALRIKGETVDEIAGLAQIMREKSLRVEFDGPLVDTCGTGGDGAGNRAASAATPAAASGHQHPLRHCCAHRALLQRLCRDHEQVHDAQRVRNRRG